ncbi:MAG: alpha-galactosidase [Lachnospiraceae bacterium]
MAIIALEEKKIFNLETKDSTYQIKVNELGFVLHTYYGKKIKNQDMSYQIIEMDRGFSGNPYEVRENRGYSLDTLPQEYSSHGVGDFRVASIQIESENGSRSVEFRYKEHKISKGKVEDNVPHVRDPKKEGHILELILEDLVAGLELTLTYSVFFEQNIITRTSSIRNIGKEKVKVEKIASMCIDFMHKPYDLISFPGRHCMERMTKRDSLKQEIRTISSNRGMSSHHNNPFIILTEKQTTQDQGSCYGFMLMYSGSHKSEIEVDQAGSTRVVMGINDETFSWDLSQNEEFKTPEVILSFSEEGLNKLSQQFHKIIREQVCDPKYLEQRRPVLINNWEATYFDFNTEKILNLANKAKEIGIEMFVLDDGWFGSRNNDNEGLGDWVVNEEKLEGGLKKLATEINKLGMKFGLWFEPEMVNENSDLFRAHPEWVLRDPMRKPMMSRNQMVLDLSNPLVQNYLYDSISKILDDAPISYIKWDFNRSVSNVYSNALSKEQQGEVSHRFVLGTYALLERLTKSYPDVLFEGCAGGGGRFDAGMLYYTPQIWCSDNTDPIARLSIQKGTSYGYPISTMGSHVSASPNHQTGRSTTLETRGVVAMSGTFGYEIDLNTITDVEKEDMKRQIELFKKYYWLIQKGIYFRLDDCRADDFYESWQFVSEDKESTLLNVVLKDTHANSEIPWIRLKGLDEDKLYRIENTDEVFSGAALMYGGYGVKNISGNYPSVQIYFEVLNIL